MSFKDQLSADMAVLYNTDEFADIALYQGTNIPVLELEDIDIESINSKSFLCQKSDVPLLSEGETFVIAGKTYELINFEPKGDGLEMILVLGER